MASGQDTPPPSFHYDYCEDWGVWVLDHGLPKLPDSLGDHDEVPIAYWAGPTFGAVLFRSWWSGIEDEDVVGERDVNNDHYSYVRTARGWEQADGPGGTAGPEDHPMRPRRYPDRLARLGGDWQDGSVRGVTGIVGAAAHTIELIDRHGLTRRPVEAPLGWVIVCFDPLDEVTIRVLDGLDQPLLETRRAPGRW